MAKVRIKYPEHTPEDRRRILAELKNQLDINESLESLVAEMNEFEAEYGMSTVEFYTRFAAGKLGDSRDFINLQALSAPSANPLLAYHRVTE